MRKLPLSTPIEATQGRSFTEQITPGGPAGTTLAVEGPLPRWLKATSNGGRLTISGTPTEPGDYPVTIIERRARTVTIRVSPAKQPKPEPAKPGSAKPADSVWTRPILDVILGKRSRGA